MTDHGPTRTYHWHSDYPICPYLVSLAAYPYGLYTDWYSPQAGGAAMPVTHYVFPDWWDDSAVNFAKFQAKKNQAKKVFLVYSGHLVSTFDVGRGWERAPTSSRMARPSARCR